MQVDARIALNLFWDNGGQHGQESEEGEGKEEKDSQEEVGLRQHSRNPSTADTHQGACASRSARLILPRLDEIQRLKMNRSRTESRASVDWSGFFIECVGLSRAAMSAIRRIEGGPRNAAARA
jgi:hypothetical protein